MRALGTGTPGCPAGPRKISGGVLENDGNPVRADPPLRRAHGRHRLFRSAGPLGQDAFALSEPRPWPCQAVLVAAGVGRDGRRHARKRQPLYARLAKTRHSEIARPLDHYSQARGVAGVPRRNLIAGEIASRLTPDHTAISDRAGVPRPLGATVSRPLPP